MEKNRTAQIIAIIALVWYYSMRLNDNNYDDRNND